MKNKKLLMYKLLSLTFAFVMFVSFTNAQKASLGEDLTNVERVEKGHIKTIDKKAGDDKYGAFFEGFDNTGVIPQGWLNIDADEDGEAWFFDWGAAASNSEEEGFEHWLLSPEIRLSGDEDSKMMFSYYTWTGDEGVSILLSETGRAPEDFTTVLWHDTVNTDWWDEMAIADLSDYKGKNIYLAFVHEDLEEVAEGGGFRLNYLEIRPLGELTDITDFWVSGMESYTINPHNHTIHAMVANGTDWTDLSPNITVPMGSTLKTPGDTINQDFSDGTGGANTLLTYTVYAADSAEDANWDDAPSQAWTVDIDTAAPAPPSTETDITFFELGYLSYGWFEPFFPSDVYVYDDYTVESIIDVDAHTITIHVPFETDITDLFSKVVLSSGATAVVGAETDYNVYDLEDLGWGYGIYETYYGDYSGFYTIPNSVDYTNDVTVTVTAEDGETTQDWTVTVVELVPAEDNDILSIDQVDWYNEDDDMWMDVTPLEENVTIDATNHTVTAALQYDIPKTDSVELEVYFTLSDAAMISPTDGQAHITDDEGEYVYEVYAEDETMQEWTITYTIEDPATDTEILDMWWPNLDPSVELDIDEYGKRIFATAYYGSSLIFAPDFVISDKATIFPESGDIVDFSNGPVIYTVTAEDGVTTQDWTIVVNNGMPSSDAEIWDFGFIEPFDMVDISSDDAMIDVYVPVDVNIADLEAFYTIHQYATIAPDPENVVDYTHPVEFTVTAQDGTEKVWTVNVMFTDNIAPIARTDMQTATTWEDEVYVKSSEFGYVIIFHEELFQNGDLGDQLVVGDIEDYEDLIEEGYMTETMYAFAEVEAVNAKTFIPTDYLNPGNYFAYAMDEQGNFSDRAANHITLTVEDTVEATTIEELRMGYEAFIYHFTGEAVITFMQDFNNQMYIQDGTAAILVNDYDGNVTTAYEAGDAISGFYGVLNTNNGMLEIIPSSDPGAAVSSDNVVEPLVVDLEVMLDEEEEFDFFAHQGMLVQFNNVIFMDYGENAIFQQNMDYSFMGAMGYSFMMYTNFNMADYIGEEIPAPVQHLVGIMNTNLEGDPTVTARALTDFTEVEGILFVGEGIDFETVLVGDSVVEENGFGNAGNGEFIVNNVELIGSDVFTLMDEDFDFPTELAPFEGFMYTVAFEPDSTKDEEAMIVVTYNTDLKDTLMVMGTGIEEKVFDFPYFADFNVDKLNGNVVPSSEGWDVSQAVGSGWDIFWNEAYTYGDETEEWGAAAYAHDWASGTQDDWLISPKIDLSEAESPMLRYFESGLDVAYAGAHEVAVSTDKVNWDVLYTELPPEGPDVWKEVMIYLGDYAGDTIYVGFHYMGDYSDYWFVDNFELFEQPVTPVIAATEEVDFFSTMIGDAETMQVTFANEGVSFVTINDVYLKGAEAKAADFFLESPDSVNYDVFESYEAELLEFDVTFEPTVGGLHADTIVIEYATFTDDDLMVEIPVKGVATSCADGETPVIGENEAPGAPMWYTYTPDQDMVITVSSVTDADPDTRLFVYENCDPVDLDEEGNDEVAHNEDFMGNLASQVHFFAAKDSTYHIFWSDRFDPNPFTWTFEIDTTPGEVCEMAIPVDLPLADFSGTTEDVDDYYNDPSPCYDYYIGGNDIVYTFTLEEASFISGSIDGDYVGMHIVRGVLPLPFAPVQGAPCGAFAADGLSEIAFTDKFVEAGTYYIIVSTWPEPQFSEFTINLTAEVAHREATIMEIQGMDDYTPFEDTYVITSGIVTAVYEDGYYIQDGEGEWNGIQVYDPDNYETVAVGDELLVDGKAKEYYDMTNIEDIVSVDVVSSDNDLPAVSEVDIDEIGEPWEGVLVTIGQVYVSEDFNDYDEFMVEDDDGNEIMIDSKIFKPEEIQLGFPYMITGVVNYSYDTWRIRPRNADDVVAVDDVDMVSSEVSFEVYPNPSNGQFTVTVNSDQMNDLTIELVNIQGEVIYSHKADDVTTFTGDIDVTEFAKGVYYLRVFNGENVKVEKVIVQ